MATGRRARMGAVTPGEPVHSRGRRSGVGANRGRDRERGTGLRVGLDYLPATTHWPGVGRYVREFVRALVRLEGTSGDLVHELRLFEEAKDDADRQLRLLKRDYAFEMLEVDGSAAQQQRLSALEAMLTARGASLSELRTLSVQGTDVAPTPKRATEGADRTQPREPGPAPAAGAVVLTFPLFGKRTVPTI